MSDKPVSPLIKHLTSGERFGTQTRLAEAAGVKPHTISGKATGKNPLTYTQMQRILEVAPEMGVAVAPEDFFPERLNDDDAEPQGAAA